MSGFGNDNNNENQDFGALNMGSDSMFSGMPENMPNEEMSMFSDMGQNIPQENMPNFQSGAQPPKPDEKPIGAQPNIQIRTQGAQKPHTPQAPQAPQAPHAPHVPQPPQPKAQFSHAPETRAEAKDELDDEVITVKPIRFASFENEVSAVGTPRKNLDIMQDVKAKITVELGRCKMKVKKVLDIQKGSIIEINKVAGEQVELFVCGKLVAHGEVIVIEDKFGLRITSIIEDKSL